MEKWKLPFDAAKLLQKKNLLFFLGIAGIFLIFLSELPGKSASGAVQKANSSDSASAQAYAEQLEQRLAGMIGQVAGAGRTEVMITLEATGETVYAEDEQSSNAVQSDSGGIQEKQSSYQSEHTLVDGSAGREALVEQQLTPSVQGVAVVCEGGGDIGVVARVTELVSVVLGLPTNRICVTQMTQSK